MCRVGSVLRVHSGHFVLEASVGAKHDENEADEHKEGTASDPRPLIDHETRCWPMDEPSALSHPKEPD